MTQIASNFKSLQERSLEYREKIASATKERVAIAKEKIANGEHRRLAKQAESWLQGRLKRGRAVYRTLRSKFRKQISIYRQQIAS